MLEPHRAGRASTFQRFDWSVRALGPAESLPRTDVLIVDLTLGRRHGALWRDVWVPNERDFEERYAPGDAASVRYVS